MTQFLPLLLIGLVGYMILIRPQRKRSAERRQLMSAISPGDEIITIGGMHGAVRDVDDETVEVEISEGVIVRFERRAVAAITKDIPADDADQHRLEDDESEDEGDDHQPSAGDDGETAAPAAETDRA